MLNCSWDGFGLKMLGKKRRGGWACSCLPCTASDYPVPRQILHSRLSFAFQMPAKPHACFRDNHLHPFWFQRVHHEQGPNPATRSSPSSRTHVVNPLTE